MPSVDLRPLTLYELPTLSSLNGPANLAYLVQQLEWMQVCPACIRLIPHFGHALDREILPYQETRACDERAPTDLRSALRDPNQVGAIQLQVNVRDDNRLRRYLPLITVGVLSDAALAQDWSNLLARYEQERQRLQGKLMVASSQEASFLPVTALQCFESLIERLLNYYPYLADLDAPYDVQERELIFPRRIDTSITEESAEWYTWRCQTRTLRELLQVFFTYAFLLIGSIDLIGGREYVFPVVSEERICAVSLTPPVNAAAIADWLHAFPHYPAERVDMPAEQMTELLAPPAQPALRMPSFGATEQPRNGHESEKSDLTRETLKELHAFWTTADPAVQQLANALQQASEAKGEPLNTKEILALVHQHVPDYFPTQPAQARLIGGWDLTMLLLRHIRYRWSKTSLLGVSETDLLQFEPLERDLIEGLLILRRAFADPVYLFQMATRIAVGSDVEVGWEPYQPIGCELGSDRASLGVSLAISALAQLHQPRIRVYLPLDRTEYPHQADFALRKLQILRRLFLPAHIPVVYQWKVDWAILGETCILNGGEGSATARLGTLQQGKV